MVHVAVVIVQQVEFQFLGPGCTIVEGQRIEIACSIYTEGAEPAVGSVARAECPGKHLPKQALMRPDAGRLRLQSGWRKENGGKVHPADREPVGRSADSGDSATSG